MADQEAGEGGVEGTGKCGNGDVGTGHRPRLELQTSCIPELARHRRGASLMSPSPA